MGVRFDVLGHVWQNDRSCVGASGTGMNADYNKRLPPKEFEELQPKALEFISDYLKRDRKWQRCYRLKQQFTSRVGYCFQADFYQFVKELGFETKIDERGDHFAKAKWRKSLASVQKISYSDLKSSTF